MDVNGTIVEVGLGNLCSQGYHGSSGVHDVYAYDAYMLFRNQPCKACFLGLLIHARHVLDEEFL